MAESSEIVDVRGVPVEVRRRGSGPDVLFVHGVYVNSHVWDEVVAEIEDRYTCWLPTLPLGGNDLPVGWAPTMGDIAALVPGLIESLDLTEPIVVGNDSGGGFVLLALADPDGPMRRASRVVLINCDSYDHLPPDQFGALVRLARRWPRACSVVLRLMLHTRLGQRTFIGSVTSGTTDRARRRLCFGSPAALGDAVAATAALVPTSAERTMDWLPDVLTPVNLVWGTDDKFFPESDAERLVAALGEATLAWAPGARTYAQMDQPETVAASIAR